MKWLLRLSLLTFALFTGLHVVAMLGLDDMAMPQMTMLQPDGPTSANCVAPCIAINHGIMAAAVPGQARQLFLALAILAVLIAIVPLTRRINLTALGFVPRPPDLITLYGHYRI